MKQYVQLLKKILAEGEDRADRTGEGTRSIFGGQVEFDLRERFPLVTIKKTLWKSAFIEMLWFLRGEPNTKFLKDHGVPIWDSWADEQGNLGPVYGCQWRRWPGKINYSVIDSSETNVQDEFDDPFVQSEIVVTQDPPIDQLALLIDGIKKNYIGRRHIVTAWNPTHLSEMGLPPCHRDFQCYVTNDKHLDLMMSIRSWDTCLGGPFNIAQYALLTHLIARATDLKPRRLIINYGDAHLYTGHIEKIAQVIDTCPPIDCPTTLVINTDNTNIDGYAPGDFEISGYESHPFVKLPIAV